MPTRLLTDAWREYLRGEHDQDWSDGRKDSESSKIRKRLAYGLDDIALAGKNLNRLGNRERILMKHTNGDSSPDDPMKGREGWRIKSISELIEPILALLIDQSLQFNYSTVNWEDWIKNAYERVTGGFAIVQIEAHPEPVQWTRAKDYYQGRELEYAEIIALEQYGLIHPEDLPEEFKQIQPAIKRYTKPKSATHNS